MRRMRGMPRITPCPGRALAPGRDEMGTTRDAAFPGGRSHLSPGSLGEGGSRTRRDASHPPHALSSVPPSVLDAGLTRRPACLMIGDGSDPSDPH
jgi:hypothetical protein